jgi:putative colanic acid biosynthesis acetyltransferase WcaF
MVSTMKKIGNIRLREFSSPVILGNRNIWWKAIWYITNAFLFQGAILALMPSSWKAVILRAFGAKIGVGFVCKPRVTIKCPWFLIVGDDVWIGEKVWIDNHCQVKIGSNVCISQGSYLFTGNHDWQDPTFRFYCRPIEIGDGVWITAFQRLGPGARVPAGHALLS